MSDEDREEDIPSGARTAPAVPAGARPQTSDASANWDQSAELSIPQMPILPTLPPPVTHSKKKKRGEGTCHLGAEGRTNSFDRGS